MKLLALCLLLTGCAAKWPAGSSLGLRGTAGYVKDGGSIGGKLMLHIPLGEQRICPPGAPFELVQ